MSSLSINAAPQAIGMATCVFSGLLATLALAQSPPGRDTDSSSAPAGLEIFRAASRKSIVVPAYPANPMMNGEEGRVLLSFMVDAAGKPFEATVIDSTGSKIFEDLALAASSR